jgi:hypothetical protein
MSFITNKKYFLIIMALFWPKEIQPISYILAFYFHPTSKSNTKSRIQRCFHTVDSGAGVTRFILRICL